jgi:hypothetical protein
MEDTLVKLKTATFDVQAAIDAIAAIPLQSHFYYYFSEKMVEEHPQYFQRREDGLYFQDGTRVIVYPNPTPSDDSTGTIYAVPVEGNSQVLKFISEGEKNGV